MTGVAELFVGVVQALVELTLLAAELAARPLRFLASGVYRCEVRQRWRGRPWRRGWEVFGGSLCLLLFIGVVAFWLQFFGAWSHPPDRRQHPSIRQRLTEKLHVRREARERRREAGVAAPSPQPNPALERTPTAVTSFE